MSHLNNHKNENFMNPSINPQMNPSINSETMNPLINTEMNHSTTPTMNPETANPVNTAEAMSATTNAPAGAESTAAGSAATGRAKKGTKILYNASQDVLYAVCVLGLKLCSKFLADLAKMKAKYTEAYIKDVQAAVDAAKALPTAQQMILDRKQTRNTLMNATKAVQSKWQALKSYISDAYKDNDEITQLQKAGSAFYAKTSYKNWSALRQLIDAGNNYIKANSTILLLKGNMPAGFVDDFKKAGEDCYNLSEAFTEMSSDKEMDVDKKIKANNAIYETLSGILKDGNRVFFDKGDKAVQSQFVYNHLKALVQGKPTASIKGLIQDSKKKAIANATIESGDGKYKTITNAKGRYKMRLAAGTYIFIIKADGCLPVEKEIVVETSTAATFSAILTPVEGMHKVA